MTLADEIEAMKAATAPGREVARVMQEKPATAPDACACGEPVDPDMVALRETFPSFYRPLCVACGEEQRKEDEAVTAQDIEMATHRRRLAEVDRVIPDDLLNTSLSHRKFNPALYIKVQDWSPATGRWLVITGGAGLCKSRVVSLIVKKLILDGQRVRWCRATDFQQRVEELWLKTKGVPEAAFAELKEWKTADILVIDDLGKNLWTAPIEAKLFDLIDYRKSHLLPTILTANTPIDDLLPCLSEERGGPLLGRILEASQGYRYAAPPLPAR